MGKKQGRLVKKSNALIRSYWPINSVWEPRLVALVASKIRAEDEDFKTYEIPISELVAATGQNKGGYIYDEIAGAVRRLMGRVIEIKDDPSVDRFYALFSACEIYRETGIIKVRFDFKLKPHYLQLKECFTLYSLEEFMKLKSAYSQRIFEILMSWKNIPEGEVTISMDELHQQLDTPKSIRKDFKAFRLRVLDQAQKDITGSPDTNSSLDYEWQPVKQGRKVIAVRFIFDKGRIEKERREKEEEAQKLQSKRNNELYMAANKCSKSMVTVPASEQDMVQREQKQEVCDICQSQEMLQPLFPLECRRYKRVEIVE